MTVSRTFAEVAFTESMIMRKRFGITERMTCRRPGAKTPALKCDGLKQGKSYEQKIAELRENILDVLRRDQSMTAARISKAINVSVQSVSMNLVTMERNGLVEKVGQAQDNKRRPVHLWRVC
ncbi:MAG: ArsR family transcriptional regulator [Rhodobacteraceae bacterium]|nr:MAG: ArsR family transcriptional regulator [Paracoccaceae bacterium]